MNGARVALGTVQFGLEYGISNTAGKVSAHEVAKILAFSRDNGVDMLDTAIAYGDSESALGRSDLSGFEVVTKLPAMPTDFDDIRKWVKESVAGSLARLNTSQLYGLLLHRPEQLLEPGGKQLYDALSETRRQGIVQKIGVSVYSPYELERLADFRFDLIQIPFNVLDQRLLQSGMLAKLRERGAEVHVRSVFLQGLLLMDPVQRPAGFSRWSALLGKYDAWLADQRLSRLEGCLRAVAGVAGIDRLVLGVESLSQLEQITHVMNKPFVPLPRELGSGDELLLNPANWGQL